MRLSTKSYTINLLSLITCLAIFPVSAQQSYSSTLKGQAILPANSVIQPPSDAPDDAKISGKFTTPTRIDTPEVLEGTSGKRPTAVYLPFKGQPLQGHSGIKHMPDGSYWILTDNGAGSKANSPDFLLYLSQYQVDFNSGKMELKKKIFLHDPDKKIPFKINYENTQQRYLTGSDFDPESFQFAGGYLWIGEEFGPYLIKADLNGKIIRVFETIADSKIIHSPEHPQIKTPGAPTEKIIFEVKRSKGFEGMASSADGSKLYALLEGPLFNNDEQSYENIEGKEYLRIFEFDIQKEQWTGNFWKYPLEKNGYAIGDFNMFNDNTGLVIERDNGEGVVEHSCNNEQEAVNCFPKNNLPEFKRIYKIKFDQSNIGQPVQKQAYIDLLAIDDPENHSRKPLSQGKFMLPFFTIENVDIVDDHHIVVGNDNNLPFSSSREPNQADDNELVLLDIGSFLTD